MKPPAAHAAHNCTPSVQGRRASPARRSVSTRAPAPTPAKARRPRGCGSRRRRRQQRRGGGTSTTRVGEGEMPPVPTSLQSVSGGSLCSLHSEPSPPHRKGRTTSAVRRTDDSPPDRSVGGGTGTVNDVHIPRDFEIDSATLSSGSDKCEVGIQSHQEKIPRTRSTPSNCHATRADATCKAPTRDDTNHPRDHVDHGIALRRSPGHDTQDLGSEHSASEPGRSPTHNVEFQVRHIWDARNIK